jgi:CubicO group peptidase (beta-lactamase class C family)
VAHMAELQTAEVLGLNEDGSSYRMEQGLGWRKTGGEWPPGESVITHGGQSGTRLWIDPERDLAFAFLSNTWGAPSDAAIATLRAVYEAKSS